MSSPANAARAARRCRSGARRALAAAPALIAAALALVRPAPRRAAAARGVVDRARRLPRRRHPQRRALRHAAAPARSGASAGRAASRSATSSCRRWRGASSPIRCSSSPAARARARSRVAASTMPLFGRLNNRRDIVFVDQRGTGGSAPLVCPDAEHETLAEQSDPERQLPRCAAAVQGAAAEAALHRAARATCGLFTTSIAVQDLDAVRRELGAERIDLVGASYGTRVGARVPAPVPEGGAAQRARRRRAARHGAAGELLARQPGGVRRARSPPAPPSRRARATIPTCTRASRRCSQSLPRTVKAAHPLSGRAEEFVLTRDMLLGAVRSALYAPALAAALPEAIDAASRGDVRRPGRPERDLHGAQGDAARDRHAPLGRLRRGRAAASLRRRPAGRRLRHRVRALLRAAVLGWPRGEVPAAFYTMVDGAGAGARAERRHRSGDAAAPRRARRPRARADGAPRRRRQRRPRRARHRLRARRRVPLHRCGRATATRSPSTRPAPPACRVRPRSGRSRPSGDVGAKLAR